MLLKLLPLFALAAIASAGLSHHSISLGHLGGGLGGGSGGGHSYINLGGGGGHHGHSHINLGGGGGGDEDGGHHGHISHINLGGGGGGDGGHHGHSHINLGGGGGGGGGDGGHHGHKIIDFYTKPHYEFKYAVHDSHHHDIHEQHEKRIGDKVVGEYSLHEPDGTIRVVKYEADHHNGFNAHVERKGHAVHPEHHHHHH